MSVTAQKSADKKQLIIAVSGRFDFGAQSDFRKCYEGIVVKDYVVDLAKTDYIDSAAMGMLLAMREAVPGRAVTICNCNLQVRKAFSITHLETLFTIID